MTIILLSIVTSIPVAYIGAGLIAKTIPVLLSTVEKIAYKLERK